MRAMQLLFSANLTIQQKRKKKEKKKHENVSNLAGC